MSNSTSTSTSTSGSGTLGNMKTAIEDAFKNPAETFKNIKEYVGKFKEKFVAGFILAIIIIISIIVIIYYFIKKTQISNECDSIKNIYGEKNTMIREFSSTDPNSDYSLRDYYIKTAYNCCSIGSYQNSFVSICIFIALVRQGVRAFDFEIYSVNDEPVVATSTEASFSIKETYNFVPFSEVMNIITNNSYSPNPKDPVIFHLRIMSTNMKMYQKLADLFKIYDNFFLGPDYSFENNLKNIGDLKLNELKGQNNCKIIIAVDKSNTAFMDCRDFYEYVNITSNSIFMRSLRYYDVKNTPDMNELIEYNKKNMTIVLPDKGATPPNPGVITSREMGCQLVAMIYTNYDNNLSLDINFFNDNGSAFELKPERLRFIPFYIDDPVPQNPALSYATRTVSSDYYKFEI